jgi:nucleoside-diphosphate-sugar epimerase
VKVLVIGCGYVGLRAARRWVRDGCAVHALTRSPTRAAEFARDGITPTVGDVSDPATLAPLPECDVLLYAVGHDRTTGGDRRRGAVEGLSNVLDIMQDRSGRIVYLSSVSVYGQADGSWVDEDSATAPQSEGGNICLMAEALLRERCRRRGVECCILRLAGIYGPQRLLARVESLQRGEPLAGRGDAWLNLIHAEDAAAAAVAAAGHNTPLPLYLVSDDRPVTRGEFFAHLASLIGAPPPSFDSTRTARHGEGINKRCRNARLHESLGLMLQFPTFVEGLRHSLA